mmetsp:Transcript_9844/g.29261  ORF Transcript_9844/g.29261 Transcript_9844/m.29261 type:complete len:292 (+) Transcript_9844:444-1319(+)
MLYQHQQQQQQHQQKPKPRSRSPPHGPARILRSQTRRGPADGFRQGPGPERRAPHRLNQGPGPVRGCPFQRGRPDPQRRGRPGPGRRQLPVQDRERIGHRRAAGGGCLPGGGDRQAGPGGPGGGGRQGRGVAGESRCVGGPHAVVRGQARAGGGRHSHAADPEGGRGVDGGGLGGDGITGGGDWEPGGAKIRKRRRHSVGPENGVCVGATPAGRHRTQGRGPAQETGGTGLSQGWRFFVMHGVVRTPRSEGFMDGWMDGWIDGWMNTVPDTTAVNPIVGQRCVAVFPRLLP